MATLCVCSSTCSKLLEEEICEILQVGVGPQQFRIFPDPEVLQRKTYRWTKIILMPKPGIALRLWTEHRSENPPSGASSQLIVTHHLFMGSQSVYLLFRFSITWIIQEAWPRRQSWIKTCVGEGTHVCSQRPNRTFKVDGPYELKWQHVNIRTSKLTKAKTGINDLGKK